MVCQHACNAQNQARANAAAFLGHLDLETREGKVQTLTSEREGTKLEQKRNHFSGSVLKGCDDSKEQRFGQGDNEKEETQWKQYNSGRWETEERHKTAHPDSDNSQDSQRHAVMRAQSRSQFQ